MKLIDEIRERFSHLSLNDNSSYELKSLAHTAPAWVLRIDGEFAVGIEISKEVKVNESFSSVSYYTHEFSIENTDKYLLVLSNATTRLRNEFAGIAAMFLEPGEKAEKRKELNENPHKWWEDWKDLLGNKNVDNTVHGMVGELIFLFYLKSKYDVEVTIDSWRGPLGGSQDFMLNEKTFEVKTTLVKYNDIVNIAGQYQVEEPSKLIFIRLERVSSNSKYINTVSINRIIDLLIDQGFEYEKVNSHVSRMGFLENSIGRNTTFKILEMREYLIDENFPKVDFNNVTNAENVLQVNYKMSLSGLDYQSLNKELSEIINIKKQN